MKTSNKVLIGYLAGSFAAVLVTIAVLLLS